MATYDASILTYDDVLDIARSYAAYTQKYMRVQDAFLFGSYVNGIPDADSDIDVAIVSSDFTGNPVEDLFRLLKYRRAIDGRIEPHAFRMQSSQSNPFLTEIRRIGVSVL